MNSAANGHRVSTRERRQRVIYIRGQAKKLELKCEHDWPLADQGASGGRNGVGVVLNSAGAPWSR